MRKHDPYEELANAIILRAVEDYRELWFKDKEDSKKQIIIKFFHSKWFSILTKLDPSWLIQKLEEEADAKRKESNGSP